MRNGKVFVNGAEIEEGYIYKNDPKGPNMSNYRKAVVPQGHIFVLGDNRQESYDSRMEDFGVISAGSFRGCVKAVVWPLSRFQVGIDEQKRGSENGRE